MTDALFIACILLSALMLVVGAAFWLARKLGFIEDDA